MNKPLPALPAAAGPPVVVPATAEMGSLRAALILAGVLYAAVLLALWAIDAYFHASPL
ncbi:hypothetical protein [Variovorax sp.]|jgi:hypothetical protein|uniref:hypothetical protein n=1 Tax=Variovorax sp. TaxID=1871043 RepID=UPI0037D9A77E